MSYRLAYPTVVSYLICSSVFFIFVSKIPLTLTFIAFLVLWLSYHKVGQSMLLTVFLMPFFINLPVRVTTSSNPGVGYPIPDMSSAVFIVSLVALGHMLSKGRRQSIFFTRTRIDKPILIFLVLTVIAFFNSSYTILSENRTYGDFIYPFNVLTYTLAGILVYYIVVSVVNKDNVNSYIKALIVAFTLISIYGILQRLSYSVDTKSTPRGILYDMLGITDVPRIVTSTFVHPNFLGTYLILILPIVYYGLFSSKSKNILLIPSFFGTICLLYSYSRGAWVGLLAGINTFASSKNRKALLLFPFIILLLLMPFLYYCPMCEYYTYPYIPDGVDKPSDIGIINRGLSFHDDAYLVRYNIWKGALRMVRDHPLFGVGLGGFYLKYPEYIRQENFVWSGGYHSYNIYLQIAVERGILALLVFLWMVMILLKENRDLGIAAGIVSYLTASFAYDSFTSSSVSLVFWTLMGLSTVMSGNEAAPKD